MKSLLSKTAVFTLVGAFLSTAPVGANAAAFIKYDGVDGESNAAAKIQPVTPAPENLRAVKSPKLPAVQAAKSDERGIKIQPRSKGPFRALKHGRCPDPAAKQLQFQILNKTGAFDGDVRITGTIRNDGTQYNSSPTQQSIHLYQGNTLVATKPFHNLNPGQQVEIQFDRHWNASSPSEGEFPPNYKLMISYDIDINLDGNPANDDCVGANNQRERSGMGINDLF